MTKLHLTEHFVIGGLKSTQGVPLSVVIFDISPKLWILNIKSPLSVSRKLKKKTLTTLVCL